MTNPIQFESYGAKLRNLLGPYCNTIEIIKHAKDNPRLLDILYKNIDNFDQNLAELIEFSKLPEMEKLNIRETEFGNVEK